MRLYSTAESANRRELSVFAIAETVLAVAVSIWLAVSVLESWRYVAIAASFAPLLLLRTPASTRLALKWGEVLREYCSSPLRESDRWLDNIVDLFKVVVAPPVGLLVIRIGASIVAVIRHPLTAFTSIPGNLIRVCLCTDMAHPPEPLAGIETQQYWIDVDQQSRFGFTGFVQGLQTREHETASLVVRIVFVSLWCILGMLIFLPAWFYRFSLKSTAIVWAPLLWIVPKATSNSSLLTRLQLINKGSWGRFIVLLSVAVLLAAVAKIALLVGANEVLDLWNRFSLRFDFMEIVEPLTVPPWQIAGTMNACLAIFLYWYAGNGLIRSETGDLDDAAKASFVDRVLQIRKDSYGRL